MLVSQCFSLLRSLSTRKTGFPRSGYSSNILSGLSGLLCSSKLEKASQPIHRLLSELLSGDGEIRTLDPLLARQVLSQLSYTPIESGTHLLSHTVSSIVPSAAQVLTIVFGMGTGVSPKRIATRNIRYPVVSAQSDGDDCRKLASVRSYAADCISGSAATE